MENKTLPKSFACTNTNQVLWDKYIAWLNKTYGLMLKGHAKLYPYYGILPNGDVNNWTPDKFGVILTLEEWDEIVNGVKQETKIEVMNKTVKKSDLKKIHDVACTTWQGKIGQLAIRNVFGDTVELTQAEIDEMFKAANSVQTKVLEEVFGKQPEELDFQSSTIDFKVDGLDVFGTSNQHSSQAFIGLPAGCTVKSTFFLNPKYEWTLKNNTLTVTRK